MEKKEVEQSQCKHPLYPGHYFFTVLGTQKFVALDALSEPNSLPS